MPDWAKPEMGGKGDAYLDFLVDTVKPLIDRSFPTAPDPANTGTVGSSMGGLISIYAAATRPDTFALAGVMSTALMWNKLKILDIVGDSEMGYARIYIDAGGREGRGMTANARKLRNVLTTIGFVEGKNLMYVEERFGIHKESAWARRLPKALRFLLAPTKPAD
jgi:predicted alpha/beta superfamily hydrolase